MGIGSLTDDLLRGIENRIDSASEALFDPVIRLGVTGLSRAGKTVFITSLIANLMDRGRMPALTGAAQVQAAFLQPQPDDTVPRFEFETMLAALTGPEPHWPEGTRTISELRLSFRIQPSGLLGAIRGPRTLHLDIVDYPGEWLLDLGLLELSFRDWSKAALARLPRRPMGPEYLATLAAHAPAEALNEPDAQSLAAAFTAHLHASRAAGFSDCSPGRFILPGEMAGSPALTFAPLPEGAAPRGSLAREFERRFEAYKSQIVKPFFRDHFAKIDRQVVLVDVLGAVHSGPEALEDLRRAMGAILTAFRPGQTGFLGALLGRKRIEKILFAATKADHLHHTQHPRLTAITEALLREARDRADFAGAATQAMSIASLRTTTEEDLPHKDGPLPAVRGKLLDGRSAVLYPGELPADPAQLLAPARSGAQRWLDGDYGIMGFAPAPITLRPHEGPPHIRLDRAAQFLIGDKL
ncbi:YcjX family protein [Albirhodobacter sp. R86504]|uniref:YcjX family protein n=1 Tax=Albirhodobacter sp. R86504 TaxID=3093848 RepID=UPI00366F1082